VSDNIIKEGRLESEGLLGIGVTAVCLRMQVNKDNKEFKVCETNNEFTDLICTQKSLLSG
jgi:hypothetical protein